MSKLPLLLLAVLSLVSSSWAQVDASNIQGQLNTALNAAIDEFVKDIKQKSIPDYSGSSGRVSYSLTSNRVTSFTRGSARINVQNPGRVSLQLSNFGAGFAGNWRYRYKRWWVKISDSGRYTASASGIGISTTVAVTEEGGKVKLNVVACDAQVGGLSLKLRGSWLSWIYNIFVKRAVNKFKSELDDLMCARLKVFIAKNADKIPLLG